ncbi:uncharacterized protein A4U43_C06F6990 [Asparagus officinalis]|uniref:Uncharacterized protein n=1 Tax=Asparagus officinalis TaxID=4686 RepID=A0A5P1EKE2_ASPOF|nr:uncharacterized protein A4U43_C06F6990 [Asparagus officinalis]
MRRVIGRMEDVEIGIDTVCTNLMLSCYGDYGNLVEMVTWIRNMRVLGIGYSVQTCNSVLNSCPTVVLMVKDLETLPLSMDDLLEMLNDEEALLVKELVGASVLLKDFRFAWFSLGISIHYPITVDGGVQQTTSPLTGGDRRRPRRSNADEIDEDTVTDHRTAVSDAEVEEFFEILQRMKASRCGAVSNGVKKTETETIRWRPVFVWEDFEDVDGTVKDDGKNKGEDGENKEAAVRVRTVDLDLNADPEPEGGDCTPRCTDVKA